MTEFTPVYSVVDGRRPQSAWMKGKKNPVVFYNLLKDQLTFSSLLAIGATLVSILFLAIGKYAFFLAPLLLGARIVDALLQTYGLRKNPNMNNVVVGQKMSAQYPNAVTGKFGGSPANDQVVVFMIGARMNHPLGMFGPGIKELGDYFKRMYKEIESNAETYGYLGGQSWISDERATNNEVMNLMFFKDAKGIHDYAHGPLHRDGWAWWNRTEKDHPHIGIWHEIFASPKGMWETIYINSAPLGFGSSHFPIKDKEGGPTKWVSPLVDASRGVLRTSRGRMTMTDGMDHEDIEFNHYKGRF